MSPNPALRPPATREAELARAESELSSEEARLAEQLARALSEATALASRLERVRSELSRPEAAGDTSLSELGARLQAAAVPELLGVDGSRARALAAREQALEVRRQVSEDVQEALRDFQQQTAGLSQELSQAEAGLKRAAEAAARARREEEQRARREQEAARAPRTPARPAAAPAPAFASASAAPQRGRERGRVKLQAAIDLRSDSNFFTGFSTDIGEGGVFIATVEPVPSGTPVDLSFSLPGGRPVQVSGVVRWSREVNGRTPDLMPGVGVQFTDLPPEVASTISEFVTRREPLFFPD